MVEATPAVDGAWWWRAEDSNGATVAAEIPRFATQSDAESWVGEFWADLANDGIFAVRLFEADREVYGPMLLEA